MSQSPQNPPRQNNIAVLIDGDNAQPKLLDKILLEVARYGRPTIRRIYCDWTSPNMNSWKAYLHDHAITPVQQFRNTGSKNATDSALIIDAMDILYSHSVRCFCIVSSDSDYTRLATRIREDGIMFIGIGRANTPPAFVKACDVFISTENLNAENGTAEPKVPAAVTKSVPLPTPAAQAAPATDKKDKAKKTPAAPKKNKGVPPLKMLQKAFAMSVQEDGWAHLGAMGEKLRQIDPAFDPRTWGYSQLSALINSANGLFTLKKQGSPGAGGQYVKLKTTSTKS